MSYRTAIEAPPAGGEKFVTLLLIYALCTMDFPEVLPPWGRSRLSPFFSSSHSFCFHFACFISHFSCRDRVWDVSGYIFIPAKAMHELPTSRKGSQFQPMSFSGRRKPSFFSLRLLTCIKTSLSDRGKLRNQMKPSRP